CLVDSRLPTCEQSVFSLLPFVGQWFDTPSTITPAMRRKACNLMGQTDLEVDDQCPFGNECEVICYEAKSQCKTSRDTKRYRITNVECATGKQCTSYGCCHDTPPTEPPPPTPTTPKPTPTTLSTTTVNPDYKCPAIAGDYRDASDAHRYWSCHEFEPIQEFTCAYNEYFNDWSDVCKIDYRYYIGCNGQVGWHRNPYDCHSFYWCYQIGGDPTGHIYGPVFYECANDTSGHPM
ncbi:unnamed protein product, partial [Medioppia subpectinata]